MSNSAEEADRRLPETVFDEMRSGEAQVTPAFGSPMIEADRAQCFVPT